MFVHCSCASGEGGHKPLVHGTLHNLLSSQKTPLVSDDLWCMPPLPPPCMQAVAFGAWLRSRYVDKHFGGSQAQVRLQHALVD